VSQEYAKKEHTIKNVCQSCTFDPSDTSMGSLPATSWEPEDRAGAETAYDIAGEEDGDEADRVLPF
jgi:hypothetical protein